MRLRVGTRGSALARAQTAASVRRLEERGFEVETVVVQTRGDRVQDRAFHEVGAPGLFVREIEAELLAGRIDLAVHSYKDLPSLSPERLTVAAMPERVDVADLWITRAAAPIAFANRKPSTRVGTASARRASLLAEGCAGLEPGLLRGNVPTRLQKLRDGEHDAILLAAAGLLRLQRDAEWQSEQFSLLEGLHCERLDPRHFVPAPTQGALAWQIRAEDTELRSRLNFFHDPGEGICVAAERELLRRISGGCELPFGAWCENHAGALRLHAVLDEGGIRRAICEGRDPGEVAAAAHAQLRPKASP